MPTMICPQCHIETIDYDGFGVLHCDNCGYCTHAAQSGDPLKCDVCGEVMGDD
jgi:ribosomal protein L37AE/L43A